MKRAILLAATMLGLSFAGAGAAPAPPPVAPALELSPQLKAHPNDLSGLLETKAAPGLAQFDFTTTADKDLLSRTPGKTYSGLGDIIQVLTGGVKNPTGREELWKEGLLFKGVEPMPWLKSAANWFPRTETLQPDEMRVTFMGTAPLLRPGQMNTSLYVELGNGDSFVFDLGEGSLANYIAAGVALNELNKIFISHLHVDHFGALPYLYEFGGWYGRWHEPLTVYGPSGRSKEFGTKWMVDGMLKMLNWHTDAFDIFPAGHKIRVMEYDFRDDGGVIYDKDGVTVRHWRRSHAKDGASAYRLDWRQKDGRSLCFVWTGDGRPTWLDVKFAKGCDLFVTEMQPELVGIGSTVAGVPPFLGRYTIDTHHTSGFAAGWLANQVQPRMFMTTHQAYDPYVNDEVVAEIRQFWKGPYHVGAPDGIVVNMTPDKVWVRDGVLPKFPNTRAPQFDLRDGHDFVVPHPRHARKDIQEHEIRDLEVDPKLYYPEGYYPKLLQDWPIPGDLVVPAESLPEALKAKMGDKARDVERLRKANGLDPH